jgi:sulfate transport system ATP-binding protein
VRQELRQELRRLHDDLGVTGVLVTHDQEEALEVSDRIVVLNQGRVEQAGTPDALYDRPASEFVVRFFGEANRLAVRRVGERLLLVGAASGDDDHTSDTAYGLNGANGTGHQGTVVGLVRPRDVTLSLVSADGALPVAVGRARRTGPRVRLELRDAHATTIDAELSVERFQEMGLQPGERAFVLPRNVHVFDEVPGAEEVRQPALTH